MSDQKRIKESSQHAKGSSEHCERSGRKRMFPDPEQRRVVQEHPPGYDGTDLINKDRPPTSNERKVNSSQKDVLQSPQGVDGWTCFSRTTFP